MLFVYKKKGEGLNPLRVHKKGTKSMDGQALGLTKQRKEKSPTQPSKVRKISGEPRENTSLGYLGFLGAWDPWDEQHGQVGIKTIQEGMPRNTKNKDRYVSISHPMIQKRD